MLSSFCTTELPKTMKPITNLLNTISESRQGDKFKMFITHIGEHIDKGAEIILDKELYLSSWIKEIQNEEEMTSELAHKIAAWIQENASRNSLVT